MTMIRRIQAAAFVAAQTPAHIAHLCVTAAQEAYRAVMESPPLSQVRKSNVEELLDDLRRKRGAPAEAVRQVELCGAELEHAARSAAAHAFRVCIPPITNRRSIQVMITCAVVGQLHGYIDGKVSNSLLYAAQQALAAYPKRRSTKGQR